MTPLDDHASKAMLRPGKTAKHMHTLAVARSHTGTLHGPEFAENLMFRGGPCHLCRRACFCLRSDEHLTKRLLKGLKPVGTFAERDVRDAQCEQDTLDDLGLTTWLGRNRWGCFIVVAALNPDDHIPGVGTPRDVAFSQDFIDELMPFDVIGALYGYRTADPARIRRCESKPLPV